MRRFMKGVLIVVALWFGTILLLRQFLVQAFNMKGGSMKETLVEGDHLLVDKLMRLPIDRGDVIAFRFPADDEGQKHCGTEQNRRIHISRVIGMPGEVVELRIDGPGRMPRPLAAQGLSRERYQQLWQTHRLDGQLMDWQRDNFGPVTIPPGGYFVLGDNRDRSCDSRFWGPVDAGDIRGRAVRTSWPPNRAGNLRVYPFDLRRNP
jgi:signal peptidase I